MTNHRLTFAASIAVLAAALSLHSLLYGSNWFIASIGAVAVAALAGSLTRMATVHAAIAACVAVLIGIVPALAGLGWPGGVAAVVVLAITAAAATGARAPQLFAVLVTYVGLELVYLSAVFAGSSSWGGIIPTRHSLSDLASLPAGTRAAFKFLPPITASRPVEFVTVVGVAVIAICVDILAVRLRRPALAGLPLLLLFSVPVATSLKNFGIVQTLLFGLAISAYLSLLSVDGRQRLRMWGRLVTIRRTLTGEEPGQGPDTRQIAASGRRVGLTAVGVAMVLPLILAGGTPKDLFAKTPTGGGGPSLGVGLGGPAPLVAVGNELSGKPAEVLTYQTTASKPRGQYLEQYVLNYFGTSWVLATTSIGETVRGQTMPYKAPGLEPAVPASSVTTTITMDVATGRAALPVPYAPVKISAAGGALSETAGTLMVYNQVASPVFTVTSDEPNPGPGQLDLPGQPPHDIVAQYGGYSGPDRSQLLAIARAETKGQTTALDKANALQAWFTSPAFTYTVHARWPNSGPWLLRFLTTDPHGDCAQFAPAFAVLARLLGIPSRVAIGYTAGIREKGAGTWKVTTADAHAWPELYFPQVGWIRFEPTPSGTGEQGTASPPSYTQSSSSSANGAKPTTPKTPTASTGTKARARNGLNSKLGHLNGPDGGGTSAASHRGGSSLPLWITLAVVLFALLAWPGLARWVTTRRRWMTASDDAARASTAWRELLDYLTDYGIEWFPSESPRAIASRITGTVGLGPAGAAAIARMGAAEERSRYARTPVPGAGLSADVTMVRRALAASATRVVRLRARLLPASTLASVRRGLQLANRAFSWIDSPLPSMRRASGRSELRKAG
jgi:transglutaminase-like putative cysteine protease